MRLLSSAAAGIALIALLPWAPLSAQVGTEHGVTFYKDVLPVIQDNCQTCHRPAGLNLGGVVAPMSLMTYQETRRWAREMSRKVQSREMPPWFASAPLGVFSNERRLSDAEIETIVSWAAAGAPAGSEADAPAPRRFVELESGGWSLGTPDFVFAMDEPYLVDDDVYDLNISLYKTLTDEDLPEDVWVRGWEFKTGAPGVAHHMCGFVRSPTLGGGGVEGVVDEGAGSTGLELLTCIAEGAEAVMLPEGFGFRLEKGATLVYNMHYHKEPGEGTGVWSQPEIAFFLETGPVEYRVTNDAIGNRGFEIPPNHSNYRVGMSRTLDQDTYVLTLWPHGHLRAKAARYTAIYPDGRQELLLDVPQYDQGWQETYKYETPKLLPRGTRIDVSLWYDNSPERAARYGFRSEESPGHGPRTDDEMALGFIGYAEIVPVAETTNQN